MRKPLVSFVVPCYKLAHYLRICVDSILNQTYSRIEILILDDCSPDDTPMAAVYSDARVRYIRNETNLGHLRNYNKGISMASGEYIWLISADDCLRMRDAVERYVYLMEGNPRLAYVFSPAMGLSDSGAETGLVEWTRPFSRNRVVLQGRRFLRTLAKGNCVSAPSSMVRRQCYEAMGMFPLDLPHAGDWYLWCSFAFHGDIAYLADPLISYRLHSTNMSAHLHKNKQHVVWEDQNKVRWRVKVMAEKAGYSEVSDILTERLAAQYAINLVSTIFRQEPEAALQSIDTMLEQHAELSEYMPIRAQIYVALADQLFAAGELTYTAFFYKKALHLNPGLKECAAKLALLRMGGVGSAVRNVLGRLRGHG